MRRVDTGQPLHVRYTNNLASQVVAAAVLLLVTSGPLWVWLDVHTSLRGLPEVLVVLAPALLIVLVGWGLDLDLQRRRWERHLRFGGLRIPTGSGSTSEFRALLLEEFWDHGRGRSYYWRLSLVRERGGPLALETSVESTRLRQDARSLADALGIPVENAPSRKGAFTRALDWSIRGILLLPLTGVAWFVGSALVVAVLGTQALNPEWRAMLVPAAAWTGLAVVLRTPGLEEETPPATPGWLWASCALAWLLSAAWVRF